MLRVLYIGDMHATQSSLDECDRLIDYICDIVKNQSPDMVVFLGDQYHTHSILHLQVMDFWEKSFKKIKSLLGERELVALVGNHDRSGNINDPSNAMMLHSNVRIVNDFWLGPSNLLFVGFQGQNSRFIEICNSNPTHTVICHQTFDGAEYENGFYAKDGIKLDSIVQKSIISGHIHLEQMFGKVRYLGSPRWLTASDANTTKGIILYNHNDDGSLVYNDGVIDSQVYFTRTVCSPIYSFKINEEDDRENINTLLTKKFSGRSTLDIHGSKQFIKNIIDSLSDKDVKIRTFPTKQSNSVIKESSGIRESFNKFLDVYKPENGTSKEKLLEMSERRISWMRM